MTQYSEASFILSAADTHQFPPDRGAEVAVAGRSNSGKSSAINVIVNRRRFARTGKTPGRTQQLNFFELRKGSRLVDLPGYGFARVAGPVRQRWGTLLEDYFRRRRSLAGVILTVDARRRLTDFDRRMLSFAAAVGVPVHVLLTKADKLGKRDAMATLNRVRQELGAAASVQLFSAPKKQGVEEARDVLERFLATYPASCGE